MYGRPSRVARPKIDPAYPCHLTLQTAQVHHPSCQWPSAETVCSFPQRIHLGLLIVFFALFTSAIWAHSFGSTNELYSLESILSRTVRAKFMAFGANSWLSPQRDFLPQTLESGFNGHARRPREGASLSPGALQPRIVELRPRVRVQSHNSHAELKAVGFR